MAEKITAVKGTNDVLPEDSYKVKFVEQKLLETASLYGFREIRTPVFEHTEVFSRGVGDTTDVVQKEMYTFLDKGERSITLRPEFTASIARSVIESGLVNAALPIKACYVGGCYRYEKPQAGRLREFHQFGIECIGSSSAAADAEAIMLANQALTEIGIKKISLEINSIGCPTCRAEYHKALKEYFSGRKEELCGTCRERLDRNPMRILDCKSPICKEIAASAPKVIDFLCDDCREHFDLLKKHLDSAGVEYTVNPNIVRGLDYYTKTVFEFISGDLGAQSTVCGGGRYDGLIAQLGGPEIQAVGFAMGIERLMMVLEAQKAEFPEKATCDIYFAPLGVNASLEITKLCSKLREEGFEALTDINDRGLKAQMRYADKINAKYTCVIGDSELDSGELKIKNMKTGEESLISLGNFTDEFYNIIIADGFATDQF
ncbi:MAG: histidine--tRNA ligase [Clostridiales bacterium]|nr:histidine--tRNA ligase [Candidatus Equinaster intestinalis]